MIFTEEQEEVISIKSGRHMVIAPPGTGKTQIMAERVARALKAGIPKEKMFCGTFTVRAATGMSERVTETTRLGKDELPQIGNIHHLCNQLLIDHKLLPQGHQIINETFQMELLADLAFELIEEKKEALDDGEIDENDPIIQEVLTDKKDRGREFLDRSTSIFLLKNYSTQSALALIKSLLPEIIRYAELKAQIPVSLLHPAKDFHPALVPTLFSRYKKFKDQYFLLDFDDLVINVYQAQMSGKIECHQMFSWVQIDEVQDLAPLHWEIVEQLLTPDALCLFLGDYDQSIFSFMGASINILEKKADTCEVHIFRENFRSPSYLLDLYTRYDFFVLNSRFSFLPKPVTYQKSEPQDMIHGSYESALQQFLGKKIERKKNDNNITYLYKLLLALEDRSKNQTAILTRTNIQADVIYKKLIEVDSPDDAGKKSDDAKEKLGNIVKISGFEFYEYANIKDLFALMEIVVYPFSIFGWTRIFKRFGGKGNIPNFRTARKLCTELFSLHMLPADLLEPDTLTFGPLFLRLSDYAEKGRVVVFDTETTGLDFEKDEIIQLAAAEYVDGKLGRTLNLYLKNSVPINPEAEKVHGISQKKLDQEGIPPESAIRQFLEFVGENSLLVAHNLHFDRTMLDRGCKRYQIRFNSREVDLDVIEMCDTLALARRLKPALASYKLVDLLKTFGLEGENSHDALDDVLAAGNLFLYLVQDAAQYDGEQHGWLKENERFVSTLRKNFFAYWHEFRKRIRGRSSYRQEFYTLMDQIYHRRGLKKDSLQGTGTDSDVDDGPLEYDHLTHDNFNDQKNLENLFLNWSDLSYSPDNYPSFENMLYSHWRSITRLKTRDLLIGDERIIVSTIHKAKGLEFENVIVPGTNSFPPSFITEESDLEENKRVLYVAMSRSKKRLILLNDESNNKSPLVSPFTEPVQACFEPSFVDYFEWSRHSLSDNDPRYSWDPLCRLSKLMALNQNKICPPDIDSILSDDKLYMRILGIKLLRWMKDPKEKQGRLAAILAEPNPSATLLSVTLGVIKKEQITGLFNDIHALALRCIPDWREIKIAILDFWGEFTAYQGVVGFVEGFILDPDGYIRFKAARILEEAGYHKWDNIQGLDSDFQFLFQIYTPSLKYPKVNGSGSETVEAFKEILRGHNTRLDQILFILLMVRKNKMKALLPDIRTLAVFCPREDKPVKSAILGFYGSWIFDQDIQDALLDFLFDMDREFRLDAATFLCERGERDWSDITGGASDYRCIIKHLRTNVRPPSPNLSEKEAQKMKNRIANLSVILKSQNPDIEKISSALTFIRNQGIGSLFKEVRTMALYCPEESPLILFLALKFYASFMHEPSVREAVGDLIYGVNGKIRVTAAKLLCGAGVRKWEGIKGDDSDYQFISCVQDPDHRGVLAWKKKREPERYVKFVLA